MNCDEDYILYNLALVKAPDDYVAYGLQRTLGYGIRKNYMR